MAAHDVSFVRDELVPSQPAPPGGVGVIGWLRGNLFSSLSNTILTVLAALFLLWLVPFLFDFLVAKAVFVGTPDDCRAAAGACWAFIASRITFIIYGFFPATEYWRPNAFFLLTLVLVVPLLMPSAPFKRLNAVLFFVAFPIVSFFLLNGLNILVAEGTGPYNTLTSWGLLSTPRGTPAGYGVFMPFVPTDSWGGLLVTVLLSIVGIIGSFPIGILLALGRRSKLPAIKTFCILFIELWRAVPLITVLFMASVILPLFMPQGASIDKLLRAMVGLTLFYSAYVAEVVRGGLQALPRGQYEAASALGLNYWKSNVFIVLPQALTMVIPGLAGTFISLLKDTSLVAIIGLFDLLNAIQTINGDVDWKSGNSVFTAYAFAAIAYFILCYAIASYSLFVEKRLSVSRKR